MSENDEDECFRKLGRKTFEDLDTSEEAQEARRLMRKHAKRYKTASKAELDVIKEMIKDAWNKAYRKYGWTESEFDIERFARTEGDYT